jgi:hypothetical protein
MRKNVVLAVMCLGFFTCLARAQQAVYLVDGFDPTGVGGNSYIGGHIGSVWMNWFGSGFQSLVWDSASDASNNPSSGSMKITANFNSTNNQFEVYDGQTGTTNLFTVKVADNGTTSLSATNTFTVTVNPLAQRPRSLRPS